MAWFMIHAGGLTTIPTQKNIVNVFWLPAGLKAGQRVAVMALGHPVVVMSDEGGHVLALRHDVHAGTLGPGDAIQARDPADGDKVG
jgi:hypothetical protein